MVIVGSSISRLDIRLRKPYGNARATAVPCGGTEIAHPWENFEIDGKYCCAGGATFVRVGVRATR
jgi:hypothetical protein